ncbi:MAG: hypothetical protein D6728_01585 [Cyanobacteria bacterium J055]|nr:MAG: hypothetical protein D6728_01585 [Cyanobacteria bacterium J055]
MLSIEVHAWLPLAGDLEGSDRKDASSVLTNFTEIEDNRVRPFPESATRDLPWNRASLIDTRIMNEAGKFRIFTDFKLNVALEISVQTFKTQSVSRRSSVRSLEDEAESQTVEPSIVFLMPSTFCLLPWSLPRSGETSTG